MATPHSNFFLLLCIALLSIALALNLTEVHERLSIQRQQTKEILSKIEQNVLQARHRHEEQLQRTVDSLERLRSHEEVRSKLDSTSSMDSGVAQDASRAFRATGSDDVPPGLIDEINRLASSSIPRESLIDHVGTHFPHKKTHELNDIIISATAAMENSPPETTDTKHAKQEQLAFQATKFQRSQSSFEARKKEMLKQHRSNGNF